MRLILLCGKGGVGKSTLAASLAARSAATGARTLLFSVDPAHSLASLLSVAVRGEVTEVGPNLWATELDAMGNLAESWQEARSYAESLLRGQGIDRPLGRELALLPGIEEISALVTLKRYADSGQFDAIILDNAPTAFALRLLALPEIIQWYAKHARKLYERWGAQALAYLPLLGANIPLPNADSITRGLAALDSLQSLPRLLADPSVTAAKLVMGPDSLSLEEAKNLYTWLSLYGISVDEALMNPMLPNSVGEPFFQARRMREAEQLAEAQAVFSPLPVRRIDMRAIAPAGLPALAALGAEVWPSATPTASASSEQALTVEIAAHEAKVAIKLPFIAREAVDLAKYENELYITVGDHRRNMLLPPETTDMQPIKAKFGDGKLVVTLARIPAAVPATPDPSSPQGVA